MPERLSGRKSHGSGRRDWSSPGHLPTWFALVHAEKVASVRFGWRDAAGARRKVDEEIEETDREAAAGTPESLEEEFGDLLFAIVNWGRLLGTHPDTALRRANRKFESRFRKLESLAEERGIDIEASSWRCSTGYGRSKSAGPHVSQPPVLFPRRRPRHPSSRLARSAAPRT
jgi:hypothetical protein